MVMVSVFACVFVADCDSIQRNNYMESLSVRHINYILRQQHKTRCSTLLLMTVALPINVSYRAICVHPQTHAIDYGFGYHLPVHTILQKSVCLLVIQNTVVTANTIRAKPSAFVANFLISKPNA